MDDQTPMTIRGLRFSRWRRVAGKPQAWVDRRDLVSGMMLAFLAATPPLALIDFRKGHVSGPQFVLIAVVMAIALIWVIVGTAMHESGRGTRRIRKGETMPKPAVPPGIPEDALPCIAFVNTGSGVLPTEPGWVWLDEGLLHYRDEFMEFAVRAEDVGDLEYLLDLGCAPIALPEGFPHLSLSLEPAILVDGEVVQWNPGELPLYQLAESWKSTRSEREPVYPPIEAAPAKKVLPWFVSAAASGLVWGAVVYVALVVFRLAVPPEMLTRPLGKLEQWLPWLPLLGFAVVRIPQACLDVSWRRTRRRQIQRLPHVALSD